MTQLKDQVVWITGASSGIGEALAISASQQGARLVLSARRVDELERVRARCANPEQVSVLPCDLMQVDQIPGFAKQARAAFGPVSVLVNNAGLSQRSLLKDTELPVYRRLMELDYFAPVALTQAVLPDMLAAKAGHVVAISSVVGKMGVPLRTGYSAAKHALHGFYEAARAELHAEGLRFTIACPGFVQTDVSRNALNGQGGAHGELDEAIAKGITPQQCAKKVWRAVEQNRDEVVIGKEAYAVLLKRFAPGLMSRILRTAKVT